MIDQTFWRIADVIFALLFGWIFLADLIGASRYQYRPLAWRSIGSLMICLASALSLVGLFGDLHVWLQRTGMLWFFWWNIRQQFQQGMQGRGITPRKLLFFQKPSSANEGTGMEDMNFKGKDQ